MALNHESLPESLYIYHTTDTAEEVFFGDQPLLEDCVAVTYGGLLTGMGFRPSNIDQIKRVKKNMIDIIELC